MLELKGTIKTFVGATTEGRERTCNLIRTNAEDNDFRAHPTFDILFSRPETMFKKRIQDAAQAKRRFNYVRRVFSD